MFEVGFSELLMVGLVALLVVGPERLPTLARVAGFWIGKARNTAATIKAELRQEFELEESRHMLGQAMDESEAAMQEINSAMEAFPAIGAKVAELADVSKPVP